MFKATCSAVQTEIRKSMSSLIRASVEKEVLVESGIVRRQVENDRAQRQIELDREKARFEAASLNAVSLNKSSPSVFSSPAFELKTISTPQE